MLRSINRSIILAVFFLSLFVTGIERDSTPVQAASEPEQSTESAPLAVCTPDTSDMISYWPLEDGPATPPRDFEDVVGTNVGSCAVTQTCPVWVTGKIGNAFNFDGSDRIIVGDSDSLNFETTDSFSFEAWIKTEGNCDGDKVIIGEYNGSGAAAWWLGCGLDDPLSANPNTIAILSLRSSNHADIELKGNTILDNNQWHYLVGVHDSNLDMVLLFVDGQLDVSVPANNVFGGSFSGTDFVTIGYYQSGTIPPFQPGYHFTGILDEIAVYGKALSEGEIQAHYNGGMGQSYCKEPPQIANPGTQTNDEGDTGIALQIQASGDFGTTLTYSATGVPPGLNISASTGLITGSLDYDASAGIPYSAQVTVENDNVPPQSSSITFNWVVNDINRAPTVNNPGTQNSAEGAAVSLPISASDLDGHALSYSAASLPPGLSINAGTGVINGTVSYDAFTGSAYSTKVTVIDNGSPPLSASTTFTWNISNTNRKPDVVKPSNQKSKINQSVSLQVEANDPDGDAITFSASGLPEGLSIHFTTGLISGTVASETVGVHSVTLSVTDGKPGGTKTVTFTWTIDDKWYIFQPLVFRSVP